MDIFLTRRLSKSPAFCEFASVNFEPCKHGNIKRLSGPEKLPERSRNRLLEPKLHSLPFPPIPTILRTSGFHCKLCIFRFLPTTMSKSWYIVVCLSVSLFACLCVCHSLFLTLTAIVFITDKPLSLWLDKRWVPKVRQCRHCVGTGRAHEHGILDLCQSSTCDGCWKQA